MRLVEKHFQDKRNNMSLSKSVLYLFGGYETSYRGLVGRIYVEENGDVWQTAGDTVTFCRCCSKLSAVTYCTCVCVCCVCRFAHAVEKLSAGQ